MDEAAYVCRQLALATPRAEEINISVGLPHITAYLQESSVLNWMSWEPEVGEVGIGGWEGAVSNSLKDLSQDFLSPR